MFKRIIFPIIVFLYFGFFGTALAYTVGNTTYTYSRNVEKVTDQFIISTPGQKRQVLPGPISSDSARRKNILECLSGISEDLKGFPDWRNMCIPSFEIVNVSPRKRYIELRHSAFEYSGYEIYGIQEKKIIFSYDGYLEESRWTPDKQQLITIIKGSMAGFDAPGVLMSVRGKFPKFQLVVPETYDQHGATIAYFSIYKLTNKVVVIKETNIGTKEIRYFSIDLLSGKILKTIK